MSEKYKKSLYDLVHYKKLIHYVIIRFIFYGEYLGKVQYEKCITNLGFHFGS